MCSGKVLPVTHGSLYDNFITVANRGPSPSGCPCVNSDGRLTSGYGIPESGDPGFDIQNSMLHSDNLTVLNGGH